jgi:hypothetical protein
VLLEQSVHETPMRIREQLIEPRGIQTSVITSHELRRHQDVDSVGEPPDFRLDPIELDLQLFGQEPGDSEYAETARLRHGGHDVAAVAERKEGELDSDQISQRCIHGEQRTA